MFQPGLPGLSSGRKYRKTPLISTYLFSGLATVQVLIFGGRTYFRGYDKAEWKSLQGRRLFNFNAVLSVENTLYMLCMFHRLCIYFQDTGVLMFGGYVLPWTKKRTIIEIRGEKNAVPRVISCSSRCDQRRASPIRDCPRLLPCADRTWSSVISHVEQRSSRRESRGWFFFLSRVVLSGHCSQQQISVKNEGVLIFGGVLIYGFLRYRNEKVNRKRRDSKIFQAVTDLNSIPQAQLNFRRRRILCTTLYRKPIQASNFGGCHIWPTFPLNFFYAVSTHDASTKMQKCPKWPKTQIKGALPQLHFPTLYVHHWFEQLCPSCNLVPLHSYF